MYQAETEEGTLYLYYNFDPSNSNNNLWIMGDVRCSPYAYALATDNAFTPDLIRPITWYEYDHVTTETFIYGVNMTSTCEYDIVYYKHLYIQVISPSPKLLYIVGFGLV